MVKIVMIGSKNKIITKQLSLTQLKCGPEILFHLQLIDRFSSPRFICVEVPSLTSIFFYNSLKYYLNMLSIVSPVVLEEVAFLMFTALQILMVNEVGDVIEGKKMQMHNRHSHNRSSYHINVDGMLEFSHHNDEETRHFNSSICYIF